MAAYSEDSLELSIFIFGLTSIPGLRQTGTRTYTSASYHGTLKALPTRGANRPRAVHYR